MSASTLQVWPPLSSSETGFAAVQEERRRRRGSRRRAPPPSEADVTRMLAEFQARGCGLVSSLPVGRYPAVLPTRLSL